MNKEIELEELRNMPVEMLAQLSGKTLAPYIQYLREEIILMERDMVSGFMYATTGELAKEFGATDIEAAAIETRTARLMGASLNLVPPLSAPDKQGE